MNKQSIMNVIQAITMLFWGTFLNGGDSYYVPYLVITVLGFVCFVQNGKEIRGQKVKPLSLGAGLFSLMVLAANYVMISGDHLPSVASVAFRQIYKLFLMVVLGAGGYFAAWNILYFFEGRIENCSWKKNTNRDFPPIIFWVSFVSVSVLYTAVMLICKYPGNLSYDSMRQIEQLITGNYSNHHPFYHTVIIKLFLTIGFAIFGDINAAVAVYHVFQILFMAMCFSMVAFTMYEMGISFKWVVITVLWYMLMPFHIMYSLTMWKDVMFGGFVLLFLVSVFRMIRKARYKPLNYMMFVISGLGMCLFRSNGFFVYVITFIAFFALFGKKEKKICAMFIGIIAATFAMKHFVLSSMGVKQPDVVEALSIPIQQIARVIKDHNDFTEEQRDILSKIVDMEAISEAYLPYISDPVKALVRKTGNQQYIIDEPFVYIKLYINIGLKHPLSYVRAWIDGTRGYWNGGYSYWRWIDGIQENEYGIERTVRWEKANRFLDVYLWLFENSRFLQLFLCIGFYVWVDLFFSFICIVRKDWIGLFMTIPILAVVVSLLVSTPVYSEFRYVYAVFCSLPFVIFAVLFRSAGRHAPDQAE